MNPLISIILPTYNGKAERLSQSIDSVIAQTYARRELIIINDASTNDIEKTILKYVAKDKRIRYLKNETNLKLPKTLNKGITLSQWEYIARIDDDDIWCDAEKLAKQVAFMEQNPDYWVIWTHVEFIDEKGTLLINKFDDATDKPDCEIRKKILSITQLNHQTVLIRKSIFTLVGWYNGSLDYYEDHELWLRFGTISKLYQHWEQMVQYRINTQWMSRWINYSKKISRNLQNFGIYRIYKNKYPNKLRWFIAVMIQFLPDPIINFFTFLGKKLKI